MKKFQKFLLSVTLKWKFTNFMPVQDKNEQDGYVENGNRYRVAQITIKLRL